MHIYDRATLLGALTYTDALSFALTDYKTAEPLSFWESPFGPVGTIKGFLIKVGISLLAFQPWLMNTLGVSELWSFVLMALFIAGTFCFVVFAGVFVQVQGLKND